MSASSSTTRKYYGARLRKSNMYNDEEPLVNDDDEYDSDLTSDDDDLDNNNVIFTKDEVDEVIVTDHSKPLPTSYLSAVTTPTTKLLKRTKERLTNRQAIMRRIKSLPRKTAIMSCVMFLLGILFNTLGILCLMKCEDTKFSIGWFVAGGVMLCPGAYAVFIIW
jgi:hypothetical protein